MAYRIKVPRRAASPIMPPGFPSISPRETEELSGQVQGMDASAPEERMAKALTKAGMQYKFRLVVGAPKGMPGWKELDFLIIESGLLYAMEMDTAFTHRSKAQKDKLHDALLLNDKELQSYGQMWPEVLHVDGDTEAGSDDNARAYVRRRFGK
jgi:hypothetical protein